jgi:hypothetical protein
VRSAVVAEHELNIILVTCSKATPHAHTYPKYSEKKTRTR